MLKKFDNHRQWIDRKTASILLLFSLQLSIGIIMILYRSCEPMETTPHGQANLSFTREITAHNSMDNNVRTIYVQVIGQVRSPGVYQVPVGSKTYDVIAQAGGSLPGADLDAVDLTRKLSDEEQIIVP